MKKKLSEAPCGSQKRAESSAPAKRIRDHLQRIENPRTRRLQRLSLWRLISSAALDAHEQEVQQLDSLNFAVADPSILPGGVVE